MNPDDDAPKPYVPPMHLGRIVGSPSNDSGRSLESDAKRLAEIDRRIAELEAEELETGISGKLRIEQSLKELRRERAVLLGEPLAEIEEE
jgi:hypothetical protein